MVKSEAKAALAFMFQVSAIYLLEGTVRYAYEFCFSPDLIVSHMPRTTEFYLNP